MHQKPILNKGFSSTSTSKYRVILFIGTPKISVPKRKPIRAAVPVNPMSKKGRDCYFYFSFVGLPMVSEALCRNCELW